ncbi:hypothetical protein GGR52DRAFT_132672 [Hypoxylon sp. FL1284]|nr:hypothetical protein GGR52DRAFT_132672 [Hypoxylon sp. FL1284]
MATPTLVSEGLINITLTPISSPESDNQRGRTQRRTTPGALAVAANRLPSAESATLRGRCRQRSISRVDGTRNTSRFRGGSPPPSLKNYLRVVQLTRRRDQPPSRSRDSDATRESSRRRRQRTQSRSRNHDGEPKKAGDAISPSFLRHEIAINSDGASEKSKHPEP